MRYFILFACLACACGGGANKPPAETGAEPTTQPAPSTASPSQTAAPGTTTQGAPSAPAPAASAQAPSKAESAPASGTAAKEQPAKGTETASTGQVSVEVVGLRNTRGRLEVGLYRSAAGFPNDPKRAFVARHATISGARMRVEFDRVPAGQFAVAVHHDENGNGKMDTKLFGMPKEGYGFSRDAPVSFGPPDFEDARLMLAPGERTTIVVRMRY